MHNAPLQATRRAGATALDIWQPIFSPALLGRLQAIVRQSETQTAPNLCLTVIIAQPLHVTPQDRDIE